MKRFLVLEEFHAPIDDEDNFGFEPIADFDSEEEAKEFIASRQFPNGLVIDDTHKIRVEHSSMIDNLYEFYSGDEHLIDDEDGYDTY